MTKTTLYQLNRGGKAKVWTVEVISEKDGSATILVESGQLGGSLVAHRTPVTAGKNAGKANATDAYSQAVAQAESKIKKQEGKGYVYDLKDAKSSNVLGSGAPKPMLAKIYDETEKKNKSKNLKNWGIAGKEVGVQDKLDGNRCLSHVTLGGSTLFTRAGKAFAPLPHITKALTDCFTNVYDYVNRKYGATEYWIDGELYTPDASFNTINGILKKQTKTAEEQALVDSVKLYVYDVILPVGYETRHKVTQYFDGGPLVRLNYTKVIATPQAIEDAFNDAIKRGNEGLMIRQLDIPYENDRTEQLLKHKPEEDEEFEIVGFQESKKKDTLGALIFKQTSHPKAGKLDQTFKAATSGFDHKELKDIWDNQSKWLGTKMTVTHFGYSPIEEGGRPRCPKAKGQRVEDDMED